MFHIENGILRFAGAAVCAAAGVLFIMPVGLGIKNIGNMFGLAVSVFFFLFFMFNGAVSKLLGRLWQTGAGKVFVSALTVFFAVGFLSAAIMSVFMLRAAADKPSEARPAVLLGCKVRGTVPSLMLGRRLEAAYEYLNEFPEACIVVSGGQGEGEDISEAQCMKEYLVRKGISEDRIVMEDRSTDTGENIRFSKELLDSVNAGNEIVIITDSFHQFRASLIASKLGLKTDAVSAATPYYLLPTYWVREWFGIIEQIFLK
ncbi:MAG: YdcF family protein [Oscillospiraceae bacterium]|nr:YdcF family protein [Oscillospiraceae bacterium]